MVSEIVLELEVGPELYRLLSKYSEDEPRDERGRWEAVPGAGTTPRRPEDHRPGPVKIKATKQRCFKGEPVPTKIRLTNKETDKITEAVIIQHLRAQGFKDAEVAAEVRGYRGNNYAVDVYADHQAIELKGGSVSNGASAQQWRVKYGQESKQFTEWAKTADKDDVKACRDRYAAKCLADKEKARQWLEKHTGHKCASVTYTCIINADTRHVDVYKFGGFHLRLGWNAPETKSRYVKSYTY